MRLSTLEIDLNPSERRTNQLALNRPMRPSYKNAIRYNITIKRPKSTHRRSGRIPYPKAPSVYRITFLYGGYVCRLTWNVRTLKA